MVVDARVHGDALAVDSQIAATAVPTPNVQPARPNFSGQGAVRASMNCIITAAVLAKASTTMTSAGATPNASALPPVSHDAMVAATSTAHQMIRRRSVLSTRASEQIEQGEQHDPQEIDDVPEQPAALDQKETLRR